MFGYHSALLVAQSQVGYHEGQSGGHWDNVQKYSEQLPGFNPTDGQAWCATFVQWCLWQVAVEVPDGARSADCAASVAAYKAAGRFSEYPGLGFQVFYGPNGGTHTGIIYNYDAMNIYAYEGNTNNTGAAEGDGVYDKTRPRKVPFVYGYGIPYYANHAVSADPNWMGRDLRHP